MSTTEENRHIVTGIMEALGQGDTRPFGAAMAEDFTWRIPGSSKWAGIYEGRDTVREKLIGPLFAQFATTYTNTPVRILADGDWVVVECRGNVMAKTGRRYDNTYCYVIRMQDGLMRELIEYMDTALLDAALAEPGAF